MNLSLFFCVLCVLLNNLVHAVTYSIRLCTCESVLGCGMKLLMWELTRSETTVLNCAE